MVPITSSNSQANNSKLATWRPFQYYGFASYLSPSIVVRLRATNASGKTYSDLIGIARIIPTSSLLRIADFDSDGTTEKVVFRPSEKHILCEI